VIKRRFYSDIILEKDFKIILHEVRYPMPRTLRKEAIDDEGNLHFILQQDKKSYYLEDCIRGRITIPGNIPKPKEVSVSLVKWECYRLMAIRENVQEHSQLIERINLSNNVTKEDTDDIIPFKFCLSHYDLSPSLKYIIAGSICFYVGYYVEVILTGENDEKFTRTFCLPINRVLE